MPELLLELFSEEIPARMQSRAAEDLARLASDALAPLSPTSIQPFGALRRIALAADLRPEVPATASTERGPRTGAPDAALAGFLRKHGAARDQLVPEGEYWVLHKQSPAVDAATLVAQAIPPLLRRFPWPKSMRWGTNSAFTWVRPLRRILCLLDGQVVPFALADGTDDAHALRAGNETEGHRFHAPAPFVVTGFPQWIEALRDRRVLVAAGERRRLVADGIARLAAAEDLEVVDDPALLDEVAGLVEWPVPLLGRIDAGFMDLPPEVRQVSMRVNQRYFALRHKDGTPAPRFAFVSNIEPADGGAAVVAGNERVLRARFSDARHFWDLDRRTKLADRVPALDRVVFHAKLGSQGDRVRRLVRLAGVVAGRIGAPRALAERAALLCKADLTTGLVGEFPELQGVIGGYYAAHDGADPRVAAAVRDHYAPRGPADPVPTDPVSVAVALADKLDQLAAFFAVSEQPTGSGDPYALRRAALGIIRIIRENTIRLSLKEVLLEQAARIFTQRYYENLHDRVNFIRSLSSVLRSDSVEQLEDSETRTVIPDHADDPSDDTNVGFHPRYQVIVEAQRDQVLAFIIERLRVQLRAEGARHDVLAAVFAAGGDDDLVRLLARTDALAALLGTEDGANLLTAYKRAANILRIEDRKDGPHHGLPDRALIRQPEEQALADSLDAVAAGIGLLHDKDFAETMRMLATLRAPVDGFFDKVTVNAPEPELRRNRLRLLHTLRAAMDGIADFSRIEG